MAQPGSALPWGGRGRGFKSRYADSTFFPHTSILSFSFQAASNCRERLEYEADGADRSEAVSKALINDYQSP